MSAAQGDGRHDDERITLEEIRHRVDTVKDLATGEVKAFATRMASMDATKRLVIAAGVVIVVASVAYLAGSRGRRSTFDAGA
jgi:hypothetical protein